MKLPYTIKAQTQATSCFKEYSLCEFSRQLGFIWLEELEFQKEKIFKKVQKKVKKALLKKELTIEEKWLSSHIKEAFFKKCMPPIYVAFVSSQTGYGVFAEEGIKAGTLIGEYTGIIRKRRKRVDRENDYCFEYMIGYDLRNCFIIDAKDKGNFTRFINHHPEGNLKSTSIYINGVLHIILLATRSIKKGEQLCYDYGDSFWQNRSLPTSL